MRHKGIIDRQECERLFNRTFAFLDQGKPDRAQYAARDLMIMLQERFGVLPNLYIIPTERI